MSERQFAPAGGPAPQQAGESSARPGGTLETCDSEPIRIPGSIQPHGYLVALDERLTIVQTSANVTELTNEDPTALLGRCVDALIGEEGAATIRQVLATTDIVDQPLYVGRVAWHHDTTATLMVVADAAHVADKDGRPDADKGQASHPRVRDARMLDLLVHAHDGVLFLEIEPTEHAGNVFSPIYALVRTFVARLQGVRTVTELSEVAATEMRAITGFGRVLVYHFDEDDNGRVLAEDREADYTSYLNHFFPAADIPKQARELYSRHHIRLIVDATYTPSPLIPAWHPLTGAPTDLSFAALRSVSPIHLEYMRNMGTASSMSISIIVRGKLWGLISCHHHTPRLVSFETRAACLHLGEILSLQIEAKEDSTEADYRLELRGILVELVSALSERDDFVDSLVGAPLALLRFMSAHGAAVVFAGRIVKVGETPDDAAIQQIVDRIAVSSSREVFHTEALSELLPEAASYAHVASGVLAVQISKLHRHFVLWFRPEVVRTIEWAGDPRKALDVGDGGGKAERLTPRKSFDTWRQTVRHRSHRWRASELSVAHDFRTSVLGIVLRRAEEMAQIAAELGRVNKELEAFSYSVSHDLRAPLRHIVGYGDLLREYEGERLSERGERFLRNMVDSARFAGTLVDDLLTFSQMGRAALRPAPVDLKDLFGVVIAELNAESAGRVIEWETGPLPVVTGDAAFLMLAVRNLLSNAVKYTQTRAVAHITIAAKETDTEHVVSIGDNGVGFNMRYVDKLFGVFQRLHRAEEFEGTGIGLANVRRIIERHDGRVWAEGELDKGATFYFTLPKTRA